MWQRNTSVGCSDEDEDSGIINTNAISTSHVISGLEEDSLYRITVTAVNSIANVVSETVTAMTKEAGEKYCWSCPIEVNLYIVETAIVSVRLYTCIQVAKIISSK